MVMNLSSAKYTAIIRVVTPMKGVDSSPSSSNCYTHTTAWQSVKLSIYILPYNTPTLDVYSDEGMFTLTSTPLTQTCKLCCV